LGMLVLANLGCDQGNYLTAFFKPIEIVRPGLHYLHAIRPILRTMRISATHGIGLLMRELALYGIRVPGPISFRRVDAMPRKP
jgi:hypothetical protein